MSYGTLSRRALREVLSSVLAATLPGAIEVPHIRLDAVPQGIEERGYALEGFRSRDDVGRKRRNTQILKRHIVSIRYAKRLGHEINEDRATAEGDIDDIERAIRNSTDPHTADYSCTDFESVESVDPSGEWVLYDLSVEVLCMLKLRDPADVAVGLQ